MNAQDIYAEINRLHELRDKLCDDEKNDLVGRLKDLSWLKGVRVRYEQSFYAAGLQRHVLEIVNPPKFLDEAKSHFLNVVDIYGDSTHYQLNITLHLNSFRGYHTLETSCGKTLKEFADASGIVFDCCESDRYAYEAILAHLGGKE